MASHKPSQIGWSEIMARWAIQFLMRYQGTTAIFTQPSQSDINKFSKSRLKDILLGCAAVMEFASTGDVDSAELKKLGSSYLYLKGTQGTRAAISTPADALLFDELNFSNQAVINQYKSRLNHSAWGIEKYISTPTIPNFGVSAFFNDSDQKHIMTRCPRCRKYQILAWPASVWVRTEKSGTWAPATDEAELEAAKVARMNGGFAEASFRCTQCETELLRTAEYQEWVALRPGAENWAGGVSGYSMSQMDVVWRTAWDIICKSDPRLKGYKRIKDFWNFMMGEPHLDESDGVSNTQFEACLDDTVGMSKVSHACYVGIDVGKICNAICLKPAVLRQQGAARKVFLLVRCWTFPIETIDEELKNIHKALRPILCVIDAEPYEATVDKLIKKYPKTVYKARYGGKNYSLKEANNELTVPRTKAIDATLDLFRNREVIIWAKGYPEELCGEFTQDGLKQHLQNIAKVQEVDDLTGDISSSYVAVGPDHYTHAGVYAQCGPVITKLLKANKGIERLANPAIGGVKLQ
jgi:hypothetical protein